jgi:hypothetical protein
MKERQEIEKPFEFTLKLNDHIVVQRLFAVFGYNEKAVNSMDFKYTVDHCVEIITDNLKNKTLDFMNDNTEKYTNDPSYDQNHNKDLFKFTVKAHGKQLAYREFNANIYPSSVRYSVDIRDNIYKIITGIQKCLSSKDNSLELNYLEYKLI